MHYQFYKNTPISGDQQRWLFQEEGAGRTSNKSSKYWDLGGRVSRGEGPKTLWEGLQGGVHGQYRGDTLHWKERNHNLFFFQVGKTSIIDQFMSSDHADVYVDNFACPEAEDREARLIKKSVPFFLFESSADGLS